MESRRQRSGIKELMAAPYKDVIKSKGQPYVDKYATPKNATHIEMLNPTVIHASIVYAFQKRIVQPKKFCYQRHILHWK